MLISVVNRSKTIADKDVQTAIRAINRQIAEDFEPYWSFGGSLRLEGRVGKRIDKQGLPDMRGDAVLYLTDKIDVEDLVGYHDNNFRGIPYGFVFSDLSDKLEESWTTTLSHEALELIADPMTNLLIQGPHPEKPKHVVYHWFELCDAVQAESYRVDGVAVSNFVLPQYYTPDEQEGARNDFLGLPHMGKPLRSFGTKPGGYIGFFDPDTGKNETYDAPDDQLAAKRRNAKALVATGRGNMRKLAPALANRDAVYRRAISKIAAAARAGKASKAVL